MEKRLPSVTNVEAATSSGVTSNLAGTKSAPRQQYKTVVSTVGLQFTPNLLGSVGQAKGPEISWLRCTSCSIAALYARLWHVALDEVQRNVPSAQVHLSRNSVQLATILYLGGMLRAMRQLACHTIRMGTVAALPRHTAGRSE